MAQLLLLFFPPVIPINITEQTLRNAEFTIPLLLNTEVSRFAAINNTVVNILVPTALHTC